ncbi:MAG: hypothetical protein HKN64_04155 [Woeseiaceae bacterium]|nr:hypothetical protein [Woeseiaceae bacterium]
MSDDPYSPRVRSLFATTPHAGRLADGIAVAREEQGVRVRLSGTQHDGAIRSLRWLAWGCPHLLAACECTCADYEGRPIADLAKVKANDIMRKLSVPVEKTGRILVLEDAVRSLGDELSAEFASLEPTSTQER